MNPTIGVLALQGDFREHAVSLQSLGALPREIRSPNELSGLDGLIIPGGESTTIARLLIAYGLYEPIRTLGAEGLPLWGTCAGAILLADDAPGLDRPTLRLLPMTIERNGYGRQIDSFETDVVAAALGEEPYHAIFIRAPRIRELRDGVTTLMQLPADDDNGAEPIAVRRGAILATTFHPELTEDTRLHGYFLRECVGATENLGVA